MIIFFEQKNEEKLDKNIILYSKQNTNTKSTNINLNDEFFKISEVIEQIVDKNLTYIETICGRKRLNTGNALIILNNLINICEKIRCHNIICPPGGLEYIIKNPIFYKQYNITIFPSSYEYKINIDIELNKSDIFYFHYRKKKHEMRLNIIRDEVFRNIPNYDASINDLYINIRSGDVFVNRINPNFSQPPLCFYKKIIKENEFNRVFILSNGHENPIVDALIELYPNITFIHGTVIYDISVIVNAYNLVMPISTFPMTLFRLNTNLKNLYIYELTNYYISNVDYKVHIMKPSPLYLNKMYRKWKKSKEQLDLMINENCSNSDFIIINNKSS